MSRDPLEDQEYDFYNTPEQRENKARQAFRDAQHDRHAAMFEEATAYTRKTTAECRARIQELDPVLTAPYGSTGLRRYAETMGTIRPGTITYVPDSEPEGMTAHKRISLVKSGFRLAGYILGIVALPHNAPMVAAFALLALAEVLGILEENHEDD